MYDCFSPKLTYKKNYHVPRSPILVVPFTLGETCSQSSHHQPRGPDVDGSVIQSSAAACDLRSVGINWRLPQKWLRNFWTWGLYPCFFSHWHLKMGYDMIWTYLGCKICFIEVISNNIRGHTRIFFGNFRYVQYHLD